MEWCVKAGADPDVLLLSALYLSWTGTVRWLVEKGGADPGVEVPEYVRALADPGLIEYLRGLAPR